MEAHMVTMPYSFDRPLRTHSHACSRLIAVCAQLTVTLLAILLGTASAQVPGTGRMPAANQSRWKEIDTILGRAGQPQPGGVQKYSFPRSDLTVKVGDVTLKPAFALGSWVAFKYAGGGTMAMGDLVLTEREVNPVLSKLQAMGIEQTALHNHLL